MNPDLDRLLPYPFERLATLKHGLTPPEDRSHISLAIGEPRHETPRFIVETLIEHSGGLSTYPSTKGGPALREAVCDWLSARFQVPRAWLDPERHVLPVGGTREALFAFAQTVIDRSRAPLALMPNPFYQIYEGAAALAGAEPYFLNLRRDNGYLPELSSVPAEVWRRCQLVYLCTPGNPSGAVMPQAQLIELIELAEQYDFVIASDECYSEIYQDESSPPPGLLQACAASGRDDFGRCVVFHSLSKRSNVPGLRSGFVAGDAAILERFLLFRTYHGCAMPVQNQAASSVAWREEAHVRENRRLYRDKFREVAEILAPVLDVQIPAGGFYLWPRTPITDTEFARRLYAEENVTVLPGSYLSRPAQGQNPGENHVRIALVASPAECRDAATRIRRFIERL